MTVLAPDWFKNIGCYALSLLFLVVVSQCDVIELPSNYKNKKVDLEKMSINELEKRIGYPPADWRYNIASLNKVHLPVAQILIAHENSEIGNETMWVPTLISKRSRKEAIRVAIQLAEKARNSPDLFSELAKKRSDDRATAPWGGALGLVPATHLPPTVVDAMSNLSEEEVSRPVESSLGLHILKRLKVPPEQKFSASRIIIRYNDSQGSQEYSLATKRSRSQALKLARDIERRAKRDPESFTKLVRQYSEEISLSKDGDMGVCFSYQAGMLSLVYHVVSNLKINEVSSVVDTPIGFHILKRNDRIDRPIYACSQIIILQNASLLKKRSIDRTEEEARTLAKSLVDKLLKDPTRFDDLQKKYCESVVCKRKPVAWFQGRSFPVIEEALETLTFGEIFTKPVKTEVAFRILRKEDPSNFTRPPLKLSFAVPRPKPKPLYEILNSVSVDELVRGTRELKRQMIVRLTLKDGEAKQFSDIYENLVIAFKRDSRDQREKAVESANNKVRTLLGNIKYKEYERYARQWIVDLQRYR